MENPTKKSLNEITEYSEYKETFKEIYWFPNRKKHDSGFQCRSVFGLLQNGTVKRIFDGCDDLSFRSTSAMFKYCDIRHDTYMSGVNHVWSNSFSFQVRYAGSSVDFDLIPNK